MSNKVDFVPCVFCQHLGVCGRLTFLASSRVKISDAPQFLIMMIMRRKKEVKWVLVTGT